MSALEDGSIRRAATICSKARSPPTASPSPQTGIGCLDGLDQPGRPARDDLRPSHRTTVTRPLTTHLVSVIVELECMVFLGQGEFFFP